MKLLSESNGLTYSTNELREISIDTIRCVMLVCDTTHYKKEDGWMVGYNDVHWRFGYRIFIETSTQIELKYLDANKKPLPKNIVVWLTK